MDPLTILTAGGVISHVSKEVITRFFGPTADYLGEELKVLVKNGIEEKRLQNLRSILLKAFEKVDLDMDGEVPPRVLKAIIDEGSYCDDDLTQEYFSGILAGSRTKDFKDNRGMYFSSMLSGMTNYQISTHYIIYSLLRKAFKDKELKGDDNFIDYQILETRGIYIDPKEYFRVLGLENSPDSDSIAINSFIGINNIGLIKNSFNGDPHLSKLIVGEEKMGYFITPNVLGAELYLWAFGKNNHLSKFFMEDLIDTPLPDMELPKEYGAYNAIL